MEKRLPIAIVVRLGRVQDLPVNGEELTYTDNVSVHGARVVSASAWQPGEVAQITSLKDEIPIRGKVVYCEKLGENRFIIGLNFQEHRLTWSTFRAYSGA